MSNPESPFPTYVYKIIPSDAPPPDSLPEELPLSELDQQSGFIHLSTSIQVPGILKGLFSNEAKVYILRIPFEPVREELRWEGPDGKVSGPRPDEGLFPHLYNGKLGKNEIERVVTLERGADGWDGIMVAAIADWLIY